MLTRRWLLKLGAALGGTLAAGTNEGCSSGGVVAGDGDGGTDATNPTDAKSPTDARADAPKGEICGYGYGAYGYGYGYGYGKYPDYGWGYGYGYGCYGYGTKWSSSLFRNRQMTRSGPLDVRDVARG